MKKIHGDIYWILSGSSPNLSGTTKIILKPRKDIYVNQEICNRYLKTRIYSQQIDTDMILHQLFEYHVSRKPCEHYQQSMQA